MLEFCSKDDLVRIGGRSKEPELESCNLQKIMRNEKCTKALYGEIQETRNEIDQAESEIKEMASVVDSSCHLTQRSLIEELSEEQTQSLLLEAAWGKKLVYKVNARTSANRPLIQQLLSGITNEFLSVKEFLLQCMQSGVPNGHQLCYKLFEKALNTWLPDIAELQRMKQFQSQFVYEIRSTEARAEQNGSNQSGDDDMDDDGGDYDEEYVKELLERRMTSIEKQGERAKEGLVLFKSDKAKKKLIEVSDYPADMQVSPQIRSVKNVWGLNEIEKMQFLYCILSEKVSSTSEEFDKLLKQLEQLKNRKQELEMQQKVEILSAKKIIGVTITGASINHDILHNIGPSVVVVEEAAEILEPSLLAALTPSIEHLIMIGDHKQLRPQVDTYELCKSFSFDVSMMERLINNGFPFKSLTKQNRMRPEFSKLLIDIYPRLNDNLKLVAKNKPLECIGKSMYFWSHNDPERKDRTYTNAKEADRIVSLVLYLLSRGCRPSEITVIAAYLGQTKLLRNMLKKEKAKRTDLFQEQNSDAQEDGFVQVQTIDMFQGDENKYVIVSLVRSNPDGRIGFLKELSRRCVAQSRAKCGMYFVGNADTLINARESCWRSLIQKMYQEECCGKSIPLQCPKHKVLSRCEATDSQKVTEIVDKPRTLCKYQCGDQLPCNIPRHLCKKPCASKHFHDKCSIDVVDIFPRCGHDVKRKCYQDMSQLLCEKEVMVSLHCGHQKEKKCYVKMCHIRCEVLVPVTLPRCGHQALKECYVDTSDVTCSNQCKEMNSCGTHSCSQVCGKPHSHANCQKMIDYKFPGCGHPSPKKKKCSEIITWKCTTKIYFTASCGHPVERLCHVKESEVKCPSKPCGRMRKCGHPCRNACGEDCEKGDCKYCEDIHKKKMEEFHKCAEQRVRELEEQINKKVVPTFSRDEIREDGDAAAEYQKVKDLVMKFIQPYHNWYPTVTRIDKVTNLELERKFEKAKSKAFGDYIDVKFHGTSDDGVNGITKNGFRMPDQNPPQSKRSMFGQGIYFATDSSKSARQIYTKGSQKLLLCHVILGKTKTVKHADYTWCKKKLRSLGYDSVYAPRGTKVNYDEFVIFDPDQALPQYVIHFCDANGQPSMPTPLSPTGFFLKKMTVTRNVDFNDPFEAHYHIAEAHFLKMSKLGRTLSPQQATIKSIDIVINEVLKNKFSKMKQVFRSKGISDKEILAYHGTNAGSISSILKTNFQLMYAKRQAYGRGNYFSEYPGMSVGYGDGLLLCRILPGKEWIDSTNRDIPAGHNSKKVCFNQPGGAGAANASGEMIIIDNPDQILPYFVIHR